jgi:AcrR family transcriptional regulator
VTGQPPPRRGRPSEIDRTEVSLLALELFERRGFADVTMDEIAKAAKVSRRTLFRTFPSKADLVWEGLDEVLAAARTHMAELEPVPLNRLVDEFFIAALQMLDDPKAAKVARRRLKLIARSTGLLSHPTFAEVEKLITTMVAASSTPSDPPPALIARSLVAVGVASVLWWAEEGSTLSASDALKASLGTIAAAYRPKSR